MFILHTAHTLWTWSCPEPITEGGLRIPGPVLPVYSKWSYKVCKTGRRHFCVASTSGLRTHPFTRVAGSQSLALPDSHTLGPAPGLCSAQTPFIWMKRMSKQSGQLGTRCFLDKHRGLQSLGQHQMAYFMHMYFHKVAGEMKWSSII